MNKIRFGCQTYTWQMSGEKYMGQIPHILDVVSRGGFAGLESEVVMLGNYQQSPAYLADEFTQRSLSLGAICLVLDWANPRETAEELAEADRIIDYVAQLPGTLLALCQMPGHDRSNLKERQVNAIACINEVARRATDRGLQCAFHPNSPGGSVFRTGDDYELLFDGMDASVLGFAPDFGHIAKGGMDPVAILDKCLHLVKHVHFKDMTASGTWVEMGRGAIDFPTIVTKLRDYGYKGWIMIEDESARAEKDPDIVALENGVYLKKTLLPLV
jgi:inosose dehydratase